MSHEGLNGAQRDNLFLFTCKCHNGSHVSVVMSLESRVKRKRRKRSQGWARKSFLLLLGLGLIWQFDSAFENYFQYNVLTTISFISRAKQLPAITVCPSTYRGTLYKKLRPLPMTVRDPISPGYVDYIKFCSVKLPQNQRVHCEDITNVSKYIGPIGKCFSFFEQKNLKVNQKQLIYAPRHQSVDHLFKVNISSPLPDNQRWLIRVNPPDEPIIFDRRDPSKIFFEPKLYKLMKLTVTFITKHRSPPPYVDGCYDYHLEPQKTKAKTISDCIAHNYINKTSGMGYWRNMEFIELGKEFINESTYYIHETARVQKLIYPHALRACTSKFRRNECDSQNFNLILSSTKRGLINDTNITIEVVNLPFEEVQIDYLPVESAMDLVNIIGGIASLWFNFALFPWSSSHALNIVNSFSTVKTRIKLRVKRPTRAVNLGNFNSVRLIERLLKLLCSVGCFIQCWDISQIYFGDDNYYVWLSGVEPETMDIPMLTMCTERILLPSRVAKSHPELFDSIPPDEWPDHLTIDQMFDLTIDFKDFYLKEESFFFAPNMERSIISDYYFFQKSLTDKYVCFSSFSPETYNNSISYRKYLTSELTTSFYYQIFLKMLNQSIMPRLNIYIHINNFFAMDSSSTGLLTMDNRANENSPNLMYFFMNEIRQILVHNSKCFDYSQINFLSREDAIGSCTSKMMKREYKMWPPGTRVTKDEGTGLKFTNQSDSEQMVRTSEFCQEKFKLKSCDSRFISVSLFDFGYFNNKTQLLLYPPPDSYKEIRQEIRYSLTSLAVYIGGNINSWLGLAMIDLIGLFKQMKQLVRPR